MFNSCRTNALGHSPLWLHRIRPWTIPNRVTAHTIESSQAPARVCCIEVTIKIILRFLQVSEFDGQRDCSKSATKTSWIAFCVLERLVLQVSVRDFYFRPYCDIELYFLDISNYPAALLHKNCTKWLFFFLVTWWEGCTLICCNGAA